MRDCGPSTEKIHLGFKTPHGKIPLWIQDLLTEKNRLPCIIPSCPSIRASFYVLEYLAHV